MSALWQQLVREFHEKHDRPVGESGACLSPDRMMHRARLMMEELSEVITAADEGDSVELADGLGDLLVVVIGTAVEAGIPMDPVFREIMRSNMTKEPSEDRKIKKGPNYEPPNVNIVRQGPRKARHLLALEVIDGDEGSYPYVIDYDNRKRLVKEITFKSDSLEIELHAPETNIADVEPHGHGLDVWLK